MASGAQNDSGMFELNLRDERYLPFEGAGAISTWRIELPNEIHQFDFETVSDVVLHLRYTAREAGQLKPDTVSFLKESVLQDSSNVLQLFCLNHDFGSAWSRFINADTDETRKLEIALSEDHFPYWVNSLGISDNLSVAFAVIDRKKRKLTLVPTPIDLEKYEQSWSLHIDRDSPEQDSTIFNFLRRHKREKVYIAVSYTMAAA